MQYVHNTAKYMSTLLPAPWWIWQTSLGTVRHGQVAKTEGPLCVCSGRHSVPLPRHPTTCLSFWGLIKKIFQIQSVRGAGNWKEGWDGVGFHYPIIPVVRHTRVSRSTTSGNSFSAVIEHYQDLAQIQTAQEENQTTETILSLSITSAPVFLRSYVYFCQGMGYEKQKIKKGNLKGNLKTKQKRAVSVHATITGYQQQPLTLMWHRLSVPHRKPEIVEQLPTIQHRICPDVETRQ